MTEDGGLGRKRTEDGENNNDSKRIGQTRKLMEGEFLPFIFVKIMQIIFLISMQGGLEDDGHRRGAMLDDAINSFREHMVEEVDSGR